MDNFDSAIKKILIHDEGFRNKPYKDTQGYWTIGVGHFIGEDLSNLKLSDAAIYAQFEQDLQAHVMFTQGIFGLEFFQSIGAVRQAALVSLAFNLGINLLKFTQTIPLIKQGKWQEACENLSKSKWAKDVDPYQRIGQGRDDRIIYMLKTGRFAPEYDIK